MFSVRRGLPGKAVLQSTDKLPPAWPGRDIHRDGQGHAADVQPRVARSGSSPSLQTSQKFPVTLDLVLHQRSRKRSQRLTPLQIGNDLRDEMVQNGHRTPQNRRFGDFRHDELRENLVERFARGARRWPAQGFRFQSIGAGSGVCALCFGPVDAIQAPAFDRLRVGSVRMPISADRIRPCVETWPVDAAVHWYFSATVAPPFVSTSAVCPISLMVQPSFVKAPSW